MLMDTTEFKYLYGTVVVFGAVTFLVYYCLLRPFFAVDHPPQEARTQPSSRGGGGTGAPTRETGGSSLLSGGRRATAAGGASRLDSASAPLVGRLPPHVMMPSPTGSSSSSSSISLADGLVSFRQTLASRQSDTFTAKERAGILSNLLLASTTTATTGGDKDSNSTLPPRGGTWIMSVPVSDHNLQDEARWDRLRPLLAALATHYNLLVVLAVETSTTAATSNGGATAAAKRLREQWIAQLRRQSDRKDYNGDDVNPRRIGSVSADVLPSHRIVASTTVAGRVALVRQVQRVGLVTDFDPAVHEQLSRFGHKVMVYDYSKL